MSLALEILADWRLVERIPGGWRATPVGNLASASGFDLLLVRGAIERVERARSASHLEVASWAVEDYFEDPDDEKRWQQALTPWLGEVDTRKMALPTRYRGDFDQGLDDLARVCLLYESAARVLGKPQTARAAHEAAGAVRYGVAPELVPLMGLQFTRLGRARCRALYERGIRNVGELAAADPRSVADPRRLPEQLVQEWVTKAREIVQARAIATADREEDEAEFDELISRFRVDPVAFERKGEGQ